MSQTQDICGPELNFCLSILAEQAALVLQDFVDCALDTLVARQSVGIQKMMTLRGPSILVHPAAQPFTNVLAAAVLTGCLWPTLWREDQTEQLTEAESHWPRNEFNALCLLCSLAWRHKYGRWVRRIFPAPFCVGTSPAK